MSIHIIQAEPDGEVLSDFERQVAHIPGLTGELLRAIAKAEAVGAEGLSLPDQLRWSLVVARAHKLARELRAGRS